MFRSSPSETRHRPALPLALGLALALLAPRAAGQFGTIRSETKIAAGNGGFTEALGRDFRLGVSVSELGDFDGDGIRDMVVGGHRADIGGEERGAVWLLLMNSDGTVRECREISALEGGLTGPLDDHDRFGVSVCTLGDLDLDGTTDIAVGAYRDDDGGMDHGAVYVLFLTPEGTVKSEQKISMTQGGFTGTLRLEDSFGWSVETIGDLDGDGVIDLAVGATRDDGGDPDQTRDYGAVYILFLNIDGTVKAHTRIGHRTGGIVDELRVRDRFGADIAFLGDRDGDGVEDLAVGAFSDDPMATGKVFVVHLHPDGTVKSLLEISKNVGGFTGILGRADRFGLSLAADDLDGDGIQDLVIGAPGDDDGGADAGAVWVCLLTAPGRVRAYSKISPDTGGFGGFLRPDDNFGVSLAVLGDVDRDGAVDLAVGAYQDDTGDIDSGAVWLLFRAGTGAPVADFFSLPNAGYAPLEVTFENQASGDVTAWTWDFGDGTTTTEQHPVHVYQQPGTYDVALTVQGTAGSDTLLRQRTAVALEPIVPVAGFDAKPVEGVAPLTVSFVDRSWGSITSWLWDFGDGAVSTLPDPRHVYQQIGRYSVSLTVSGSLGSSNLTYQDLVDAHGPPPTPGFAADVTEGFPPLDVAFSDRSSADATSWLWDFGDGATSTQRDPVHVYNTWGAMDVTLTVGNADGTSSLTRAALVNVLQPLTAAFEIVSPGGLAPVTVQFNDLSHGGTGPTAWLWDLGDGTTSTERSPSHTYALGGNYTVRLTVQDGTRSSTTGLPLNVAEPLATPRFLAETTFGVAPLRVQFRDRSDGHVTSWEWDFGDGLGSTEREPQHRYRAPGVYTVRFRVGNGGGQRATVRTNYIRVVWPDPAPLGSVFNGSTFPTWTPTRKRGL